MYVIKDCWGTDVNSELGLDDPVLELQVFARSVLGGDGGPAGGFGVEVEAGLVGGDEIDIAIGLDLRVIDGGFGLTLGEGGGDLVDIGIGLGGGGSAFLRGGDD